MYGLGRLPCLSFSHVFAHDDDVESAVRIPNSAGGFFTQMWLPSFRIFRNSQRSTSPGRARQSSKMLLHLGLIVCVDDEGDGLTDQCVGVIPQFGGGSGIDREEVAFGVDGQ